MTAILVLSPSGGKSFLCDAAGADAIEAAYWKSRGISSLHREPMAHPVQIDFGGAAFANEPEVRFSAAGIDFTVSVRQAAYAYEALTMGNDEGRVSSSLPSTIRLFGGWIGIWYLFSVPTCDAAAAALQPLLADAEKQAVELERKMVEAFKSHPHLEPKPEIPL